VVRIKRNAKREEKNEIKNGFAKQEARTRNEGQPTARLAEGLFVARRQNSTLFLADRIGLARKSQHKAAGEGNPKIQTRA
jgi:hypothetical protein